MKLASLLLLFACAVLPVITTAQQSPARAGQTAPLPAVLYTATPVYESVAALRGGERFPRGAQIMLLRSGHAAPVVPGFAAGFAATADASISFDGKTVLFAGKQNAGDPWQIWSAAVDGGAPHRVLSGPTDLIRPLWLPAG